MVKAAVRSKAVVLLLLTCCLLFSPIVGFCNCSMFCCTFLYVPSSFAIILIGKRELVALLSLSSWCLVIVVWLFLAVPWVSLQFVIVVFPDHNHLLFLVLTVDYALLSIAMLYLFIVGPFPTTMIKWN